MQFCAVLFSKDLIDRGPDSPGVVRLVRHLMQLGKAGQVFPALGDSSKNLRPRSALNL